MRARSERERRLWRAAFALVFAIYLSAYFVQFALDFLRERNLLRATIGVAFALVAGAAVAALARAGAGWRTWSSLALVAAAYAVAALALDVVQERIHLIEYGTLALLAQAALAERAGGSGAPAASAYGGLAFATAAGVGDELLQGILPNRVGELRDVGLNALSAALAVASALALQRTLARDRRVRTDARAGSGAR